MIKKHPVILRFLIALMIAAILLPIAAIPTASQVTGVTNVEVEATPATAASFSDYIINFTTTLKLQQGDEITISFPPEVELPQYIYNCQISLNGILFGAIDFNPKVRPNSVVITIPYLGPKDGLYPGRQTLVISNSCPPDKPPPPQVQGIRNPLIAKTKASKAYPVEVTTSAEGPGENNPGYLGIIPSYSISPTSGDPETTVVQVTGQGWYPSSPVIIYGALAGNIMTDAIGHFNVVASVLACGPVNITNIAFGGGNQTEVLAEYGIPWDHTVSVPTFTTITGQSVDLEVRDLRIPREWQGREPDELNIRVDVVNNGPDTAHNVRVQFMIAFPGMVVPQVTLECIVGDVLAGEDNYRVAKWDTVVDTQLSDVTIHARAFALECDPNPTNNTTDLLVNDISWLDLVVNRDGYGFPNTTGDPPCDDPRVGWQLFSEIFGEENVQYPSDGSIVKRELAEKFFWDWCVYNRLGGKCFGMALTSLRFFTGVDDFRDLDPDAPNVNGMGTDYKINEISKYEDPVWWNIVKFFAYQMGNQYQDEMASQGEGNISQALERIKNGIRSGDPVILAMMAWDQDVGHAVVPYRVVEMTRPADGAHWADVYFYDNRFPDTGGIIARICPNGDCPCDLIPCPLGHPEGKNFGWAQLMTPSGNPDADAGTAFFRGKVGGLYVIPMSLLSSRPDPSWDDGSNTFLWGVSGAANMLITDEAGNRLGYDNGALVQEIPRGIPLLPPMGECMCGACPCDPKPPEFYALPVGDYTVRLSGNGTGIANVELFGPGRLLTFTADTMTPTTEDTIHMSQDGATVTLSTNTDDHHYSATLIKSLEGLARIFSVSNVVISADEEQIMQIGDGGSSFAFINDGEQRTYDLVIEQEGTAGESLASFTSLVIGTNDRHIVQVGDWNDLENSQITLEIDEGSDGTIDDTLVLHSPPIAEAGGPYISSQGSPIILDASGSSDPDGTITLYEWDVNNDGTYDYSSASSATLWVPADNYSGDVVLRVTDNDRLQSVASAFVSVTDVPEWQSEVVSHRCNLDASTSLAFDGSGRPAISYYTQEADLNLARDWNNDDDFSDPGEIITIDSTGEVGQYSSLAFDPSGRLAISYWDRTNRALKLAYDRNGDGDFNDPLEVIVVDSPEDSGENVGQQSALAFDPSGHPAISYLEIFSYTQGRLKLAYDRNNNGIFTEAGETVVVDASPGVVGFYTSLAFDLASKPAISYYASSELKFAYDKNKDGDFGDTGEILTIDSFAPGIVWGEYTSLAFDSTQHPAISYWVHYYAGPPEIGGDLKLAYDRNNDGHFDPSAEANEIVVVDSPGNVGSYTSLAFDILDKPAISYYDATNRDLKFAYDKNKDGDFGEPGEIVTVDSGNGGRVGTYTSLAFDAAGWLAISYHDLTNGDLKLARCRPPKPLISSVNPDYGAQGQDLTVTITGDFFSGVTDVSFGPDIFVNSFSVDSRTQITAQISIGGATPGARDVSVTAPTGTGVAVAAFTVDPGVYMGVAEAWVSLFNSGSIIYPDDLGSGLALDAWGNIYVTGIGNTSAHYGPIFEDGDWVTLKYDSAGNEIGRMTYLGSGIDWPSAMTSDSSGNIYVTGISEGIGTGGDFATAKYNPAGVQEWMQRYSGQAGYYDEPIDIAVDSAGNVYVTGQSNLGTHFDDEWVTIKYSSSGSEEWVQTYYGTEHLGGTPTALAVDAEGGVYVTGITVQGPPCDWRTIKYDSSGNRLWDAPATYDGPFHGWDHPRDIAVDDALGNIYVTGSTQIGMNDHDYATIKYNAETGEPADETWPKFYDGTATSDMDSAWAIALDSSGNVYVTGFVDGSGTGQDYATVKYDSNGNELWDAIYDGPAHGTDGAYKIAVDVQGNVYVGGDSDGSGTASDYATVKYNSSDGRELWVVRYDGQISSSDWFSGLAVDAWGDVYVTGASAVASTDTGTDLETTDFDYATVKYIQGPTTYTGVGSSMVAALPPVTVTFDTVTQAGSTTAVSSDRGPGLPTSFKLGEPPTYFDVVTSSEYAGQMIICIDYSGINFTDESSLSLLQMGPNGWENITAPLNNGDHIICGKTTHLSWFAVVEPNHEPMADAGGPYEGYEGSAVSFDGSESSDPDGTIVKYEWDFDKDGTYDVSSTSPTVDYAYGDNYVGDITLRVTDNDGLTNTDDAEVTVRNFPSTVEAGDNQKVEVFDEISFTGSFSDPGWLDTHAAIWDWGDGSTSDGTVAKTDGSGTVTGSHTYSSVGNYVVTLTVTDDDGGVGTDTLNVEVIQKYAIWGNSTDAKAILWSGSGAKITGNVSSNGGINMSGSNNAIDGTVYYASKLTITGSNDTFTSSQILPRPMPVHYELSDYQTGVQVINGNFNVSKSGTTLKGLYYVKGNVNLSASNIRGTFTIVAEGTISISGSGMNCAAYSGGLLFFSNGTSFGISGSNSSLGGIVYVPKGQITISGSGNKINGSLFGDKITLSGSNMIITAK